MLGLSVVFFPGNAVVDCISHGTILIVGTANLNHPKGNSVDRLMTTKFENGGIDPTSLMA